MADGITRETPISELPSMLTVPEVAAWASISRGLVYDAIKRGALHSVSFGRLIRVPKTQLEAWLNAENGSHA